MDDDDRDPYDEGDDDEYEPTWRDRVRFWLAFRRAGLSRWYRRTFRRKQWEADRARFAASLSDYDALLKKAYTPERVAEMAARPHPLSELVKGSDFKP